MKEKRKNVDLDTLHDLIVTTTDNNRARREECAVKWAHRILDAIARGRYRVDEEGDIYVTLWSLTGPEPCSRELARVLRAVGLTTGVLWTNELTLVPFRRIFRLREYR